MKRCLVSLLSLSLTGCFLTETKPLERKTLGQLDLSKPQKEVAVKAVTPSADDIVAAYQEVAKLAPQTNAKLQANSRLAQLSLEQQQLAQEQGLSQGNDYFSQTINQYQLLLAQPEGLESRDDVLYQLAKAYFLKGDLEAAYTTVAKLLNEYPEFEHSEELLFRQGEYLFNQKRYGEAKEHYALVVEQHPNSTLVSTARYMLAWSDFKLFNYKASLNNFTKVLDLALQQNGETALSLDEISSSARYLVADTLRIMSVIFSYNDFDQDPVTHYQQYGWQTFSFMNFEALANYYLEKKRYLDAIAVYQKYIENAPAKAHKVDFALAQLSVYKKANFIELLSKYEQTFIAQFGIGSVYLKADSEPPSDAHFNALTLLEKKYADRSYYQAQTLKKQDKPFEAQFASAANGYSRYLETLALKNQRDIDSEYLLAESLYQSKQWQLALTQYNNIAYGQLPNKYQDRAGYAVVSIYMTKLQQAQGANSKTISPELVTNVVTNWLKFATTFKQHSSATTVLLQTFNLLFEQGLYQELLNYEPLLAQFNLTELQGYQAQLLMAHSHYNLADYDQAELAYKQLLANKTQRSPLVAENLAQSMIEQAEQLAGTEQTQLALDKYIALLTLLPNTLYREQVQYQVTQYLFSLQLFSKASSWVDDFITRYPTNDSIELLQTQKIDIYKHTQQGDKLAKQYAYLAENHSDRNTRRISLLKSAALYFEMGQTERARIQYRSYAHTYPVPFAQNLEAKIALSDIYKNQNKAKEYRFWLNKIILAYQSAPATEKEWAGLAAAKATEVFANDAFYAYKNSQLTLPLKTSLARKRERMTTALNRYQQLAEFGFADYTTQANFKIAKIYHLMAEQIMASERPKHLQDLALEQYELLIEEQAIPFEDKAIALYERNNQLLHSGIYDKWVKETLSELAKLMPARFAKQEVAPGETHAIF